MKKLLARTPLLRMAHLTRVGWLAVTRPVTMGVRALIRDRSGAVLLIRHNYVGGWHMPGGAVERGETAELSLMREIVEEGHLEALDRPQLFQVYFNTEFNRRNHVLLYRVQVRQTAPRKPNWEIIDSGFFSLDALPADTTPATHARLAELSGQEPPSGHWSAAKR